MPENKDGTLAERLYHWHTQSGLAYSIEARHIVHNPLPFLKQHYHIQFESNHCDPDVPTSFVFCTYTMSRSWKGYELLMRIYVPPYMIPKTSNAYERLSQSSTMMHDPELLDPSVTFQLINVQKCVNYKLVLTFEQQGKVREKSDEYNNRPWFHDPSSRKAWGDIMKSVMRHNLLNGEENGEGA